MRGLWSFVRDHAIPRVRPTGCNGGYNGDAQDTAALAAEVCGVCLKQCTPH